MPGKIRKNKPKKSADKSSQQIDVASLPPPAWQGKRLYFGSVPESLAAKNPKILKNSMPPTEAKDPCLKNAATSTTVTSKDASTSTEFLTSEISTQTYLDVECTSCASAAKFSNLNLNKTDDTMAPIPTSSSFPALVENSMNDDGEDSWSWSKITDKKRRKDLSTEESASSTTKRGNFKRYASYTAETTDSSKNDGDEKSEAIQPPAVRSFNSREFLDRQPRFGSLESPSIEMMLEGLRKPVHNSNFQCSDTNINGQCVDPRIQKPGDLLAIIEISSENASE